MLTLYIISGFSLRANVCKLKKIRNIAATVKNRFGSLVECNKPKVGNDLK